MRYDNLGFTAMGLILISALGCSGSEGEQGLDGARGPDGKHAAVRTTSQVDAAVCKNGGQRIEYGEDTNGNGVLDAIEVDGYSDICDGELGPEGDQPERAASGEPGADGANGQLQLVQVAEEEPGQNCEHGGQRVEIGPDLDEDGAIDAGAERELHYVCDGRDGNNGEPGRPSLIVSTEEPTGTKCAYGGQRIDYGVDNDGTGTLEGLEIDGTRYVCRGAPGSPGSTPLFSITPVAPGEVCAAGGDRIRVGSDRDRDSVLDEAEVTSDRYICARTVGTPGVVSLVDVTSEAAGQNCAAGGSRIRVGLDANANRTLDAAEILQTQYVCAGAAGTPGTNGRTVAAPWVVKSTEPAGSRCPSGGQRIQIGLDANANRALEAGEVTQTEYVCDGGPGDPGAAGAAVATSLVKSSSEASGTNCQYGGQKVESGLDSNHDNVLQASEVGQSDYVCNGASGNPGANGVNALLALVGVDAEASGPNCAEGGWAVSYGLDDDEDNALDAEEVERTRYVCHGAAGANGEVGSAGLDGRRALVNVGIEAAGANCATGGNLISYGLDDNRDGVLSPAESDATRYVCNGAAGEAGGNGTNGAAGLLALVTVSPDAAAQCGGAGQRVDAGLDANQNKSLDADEIQSTSYLCNLGPGMGIP